MDRVEEICRTLCVCDGVDVEQWPSRQHQAEAVMLLFNRWAPHLIPAMSGCPECGTARMITSPKPLGACDTCGTTIVVLAA